MIKNRTTTKEANDLLILSTSVDFIFNKLKNSRNVDPLEEQVWKDLFSKKVTIYIDSFLEEMAEELEIDYKTDTRIEDLKKYIKALSIN